MKDDGFRLFMENHMINDDLSSCLERLIATRGELLLDIIDSFNLIQHVQGATRKNQHCLDLVLTRKSESDANDHLLSSCEVADCTSSDHYVVFFSLLLVNPTAP